MCGEGYGMPGVYLDADALRKIAGATAFELWRDDRVAADLQPSATPHEPELLACVPIDATGVTDSE